MRNVFLLVFGFWVLATGFAALVFGYSGDWFKNAAEKIENCME